MQRPRLASRNRLLLRRVVVQVLSEPSFDFMNAHCFAFGIIGNLIPVELAQTEITRFWMGEIKATHARARPHRKGLRELNPCVGVNTQQLPERALLRMIRARRITRGWPDTAIFFLNEILVVQVFRAAITPFFAHTGVQALGESLSQAISESLRQDGVVVIVLGLVGVAQLFKADAASHGEPPDIVGKPGFFWCVEVRERPARFAALLIGLLAQKLEAFDYSVAFVVCI